jgi:hypothetical protein
VTCPAVIGATTNGHRLVTCGQALPCPAHTRPAVVHIIDPDYFVRTPRERPWCSHGRYVPLVEHPADATCQLCLRRYIAWERQQGAAA